MFSQLNPGEILATLLHFAGSNIPGAVRNEIREKLSLNMDFGKYKSDF